MSSSDNLDGMVPMYGTGLTGETPSLIADLRSVESDLRYAARVFSRVAEVDPEADGDLRRALYDAGAIAYRRGFTKGRSLVTKGRSRTKVPAEIIESLGEDHRKAHEDVLDLANTHVAHRASDTEQGRVILLLTNPALGHAVEAVGWLGVRWVGPESDEAVRSAETAELIAESIASFVTMLERALLRSAKSRDLDGLYARAVPMGGADG